MIITINGSITERYQYWDHVEKFGRTPDMDSVDSNEEIWDGTGAYTFPTTATAMTISSSSAADTLLGTGARTFTVIGLDANYEQVSQTISMNGQTGVSLPTPLLRVYRAFNVSVGSGATNAGDIWIGSGAIVTGVPTNKFAGVLVGNGQTLMAIYTIPAKMGSKVITGGVLDRFYATVGAVGDAYATVALQTREFGLGWRSRRVAGIAEGGPWDEQLGHGIYLKAKTDVRVRVFSNGVNNSTLEGGFDLHLF